MTAVDALTLEQKVGQLFHVGVAGTEPTAEIETLIEERHVGGVIYFAKNVVNPAQTRELSRSLQELAVGSDVGVPLFVSIDQEGGTVRRLPYYAEVPGGMAVGATGDPDAAGRVAAITARQLRSVGVNWNLAPVLDVNSNPDNPVIGVRSYGEDPSDVAEFGARYVDALQDGGLLACAKHFPGHGDTETDSHADLPAVDADEDRLERVELVPFRRAIDAGIDAIMTAHVAFPAITGSETRPATLSRDVLTGLLRERLGFDGLIATDAMEMNAIADGVGTARGAVETVRAGADAVFVCHDHDDKVESIEAVLDAVESGEIPEQRIDESVERVLEYKRRRDLRPTGAAEPDTDADRREALSISREAVTVVRDVGDRVPLDSAEPLTVLAAPPKRASPADGEGTYVETLSDALETREFSTRVATFGSGGDEAPLPSETIEGPVLCCTVDAAGDPAQVDAVDALVDEGIEPIVVAVRNPYDVRHLPDVGTVLTTYDPTQPNLVALAEVLAGERSAHGRAPVTLE